MRGRKIPEKHLILVNHVLHFRGVPNRLFFFKNPEGGRGCH